MRYDKNFLVQALRQLDREHGPEVLTVINVRREDPLDWSSFEPCCDCGVPGDWRYKTDGREGLHTHVYPDRVAFHLAAVDACRDVVDHGLQDTRTVQGALIDEGIVAVVSALTSANASTIATTAAAGVVGGGLLGAMTPARQQTVVEFRDVVARTWQLRFAVA